MVKLVFKAMLPENLKDLVDLALSDLGKAEGDDSYSIRMVSICEIFEHTKMVCLAGAVMAFTLNWDFTRPDPTSVSNEDRVKLRALTELTFGRVNSSLAVFSGGERFHEKPSKGYVCYATNRIEFKKWLETCVDIKYAIGTKNHHPSKSLIF